jgi:hypothetical protein
MRIVAPVWTILHLLLQNHQRRKPLAHYNAPTKLTIDQKLLGIDLSEARRAYLDDIYIAADPDPSRSELVNTN